MKIYTVTIQYNDKSFGIQNGKWTLASFLNIFFVDGS